MPANTAPLSPFAPSLDAWETPEGTRLEIWRASVSAMDNIAYLVVDVESGQALLVDAADEPMRIHELIAVANDAVNPVDGVDDAVDGEPAALEPDATERPRIRVTGIVTTHRHADHWQALTTVRRRLRAPSSAGEFDADAIDAPIDRRLRDGEALRIGATEIDVVLLRGHTPGSIALVVPGGDAPRILTGDSLFPGGPGKTTSPTEFTQLMDDLEARIFARFGDATVIYPGHGAPTTIGAERPHLAEWRERGW